MILYAIFITLDIIVFIIAGIAEYNVKSHYNECNTLMADCGLTGAEVARKILENNDITNVSVNRIKGELTDHYSNHKKQVNLSDEVYSGNTISAISIAAHECGHAIQYKKKYAGVYLRNIVIPISNIASKAFIPLIIIGILASAFTTTMFGTEIGDIIIYASLILLFASVLVNLVTLPVEFNASRRALQQLKELNIICEDETNDVKAMLKSAALTYVASLLISLIYMFRYIIIILMLFGDRK